MDGKMGGTRLHVLLLLAGTCTALGAPQLSAQSALDKALEQGKQLESENKELLKDVRPSGTGVPSSDDEKRRKEEAFKELKDQLKTIDDSATAKTLGDILKK